MFRITRDDSSGGRPVLRLEGRLAGPWILELQTVCEPFLNNGHGLTLELSGVSFVERGGAALLQRLAGRQVEVTGSTPFIAAQLDNEQR